MHDQNRNFISHLIGHDTNPGIPKYRPLFLDHFDKKETETQNQFIKNQDLNKNLNECEKLELPVKQVADPVVDSVEVLEKEEEPVNASEPESQQNNQQQQPQQDQVPLNFVPNHPQVVRQSADTIQCVNLFQGPECEFVSNV